jgi:hypothetical protein
MKTVDIRRRQERLAAKANVAAQARSLRSLGCLIRGSQIWVPYGAWVKRSGTLRFIDETKISFRPYGNDGRSDNPRWMILTLSSRERSDLDPKSQVKSTWMHQCAPGEFYAE